MPRVEKFDKLHHHASLGEFIDLAIEFEQVAHDFYTELLPKTGKNIRYIVDELISEEEAHIAKLQELAGRRDIAGALSVEMENMTVDRKFYDGIHLPEPGDNPDDQSILQYAMMREFVAMVQYSELAEKSPPGPVQDLFRFMANEEIRHKNDLEALYYRIIHSGGV
jgi:rubrerythrin